MSAKKQKTISTLPIVAKSQPSTAVEEDGRELSGVALAAVMRGKGGGYLNREAREEARALRRKYGMD